MYEKDNMGFYGYTGEFIINDQQEYGLYVSQEGREIVIAPGCYQLSDEGDVYLLNTLVPYLREQGFKVVERTLTNDGILGVFSKRTR